MQDLKIVNVKQAQKAIDKLTKTLKELECSIADLRTQFAHESGAASMPPKERKPRKQKTEKATEKLTAAFSSKPESKPTLEQTSTAKNVQAAPKQGLRLPAPPPGN